MRSNLNFPKISIEIMKKSTKMGVKETLKMGLKVSGK